MAQPSPYEERPNPPPLSYPPPGQRRDGANGQPQRRADGQVAIECLDVVKAFGGNRVLDGVSCKIPRGEISVIMGPSGTGKSVLLRHIVGLLLPDSGDVIVEVVMDRLKEVGLAGSEKKMPGELSGGMRKRAGFARALVMEPKILLFDEPDSGLDPVRTALLCDLIKEIQRKYQSTAVVISHDIKAVFEIADDIVLLHGGKVVEQGRKEDLQRSDQEFTRQFLQGAIQGPLGMD